MTFLRYAESVLKRGVLWIFLVLDVIAFLAQYLPLVVPSAPSLSFPPIVYWVIAATGLIWAGYRAYLERPVPVSLERDAAFLDQLLRVVPSNRTIGWLRNYDFGGTFDLEWLKDLWEFEERVKRPEFAFVDPELEALKSRFFDTATRFLELVRATTVPLPHPQRPYQAIDKALRDSNPSRYAELRKQLNQAAEEVVRSYDLLVKRARAKLPLAGS